MIKQKSGAITPRDTLWCGAARARVAPCSLCQGRFAPAPPMPPHRGGILDCCCARRSARGRSDEGMAGRIILAVLRAEVRQPLGRRDYHALRSLSGVAPVTLLIPEQAGH